MSDYEFLKDKIDLAYYFGKEFGNKIASYARFLHKRYPNNKDLIIERYKKFARRQISPFAEKVKDKPDEVPLDKEKYPF